MLAALITNMMRKRGNAPASLADFMPGDKLDEDDPWQTFKRIAAANNG